MRSEVDTASPAYKQGWHHAMSLHAPMSTARDYVAGWDEGYRFRYGVAFERTYSEINRRATDVGCNSK